MIITNSYCDLNLNNDEGINVGMKIINSRLATNNSLCPSGKTISPDDGKDIESKYANAHLISSIESFLTFE